MGTQLSQRRRVIRVGVAVFLLGVLVYPGALASPYIDPGQPGYYHNSIDAQAPDVDSLEHHAITPDTPEYQYEELSPTARELFDTVQGTADKRVTLTVCQEWTLVCDEYTKSELPEEFAYGGLSHTWRDAAVIVTDDDGASVFVTGDPGHADGWNLPPLPELLVAQLSSLAVLFHAGVLAYTGWRSAGEQFTVPPVVIGGAIGGYALLAPYLHMADLVTVVQSQTLVVGSVLVWAGLVYRAGG